MTAIHGKDAIIYLAGGAGEAVPLTEQGSYSIEAESDFAETSELGDQYKSRVRGLRDWQGKLDGNFNVASKLLWDAEQYEGPVKFYIYPRRSVAGQYYYGTAWVSLNTVLAGGVSDKSKTSVALMGENALTAI